MPDGTDWGLAWIRLERAIQKKIDKLDNGKADENADYRDAVAEMSTLEEVQELMAKYEPKERKHERLWGKAAARKKYASPR